MNTRFFAMLICLSLISCGKSEIGELHYQFDSYTIQRDWYTMDTVFVNRAILWHQDSIWKPEMKQMLDTMPDQWWVMCATYEHPLHLEHWYYLKNGKKIHPSAYPKLKP